MGQPGRDTKTTLELQAHLLNDLSIILIIKYGGEMGSKETPAISTEINKITIAQKVIIYIHMSAVLARAASRGLGKGGA